MEKPYEGHRCAHVVVDPDSGRLCRRAQAELADSWVALSATSWNRIPRGAWLKLIPFTLPLSGVLSATRTATFLNSGFLPILRHLNNRRKQRCFRTTAAVRGWWKPQGSVAGPSRHRVVPPQVERKTKCVYGERR